eukprot:TRINITY_DN62299_c0_g1_i3.p1 TRINITY_DN62299_c0_g1~~TRINITY_DN62299_c0_g1_i3.p1  ORF type:complete len:428 (-),score=100.27 TRINITY_DN62299_c0_g1_i3:137-1360(-)
MGVACCTCREGRGYGPTDAFCREALSSDFHDCSEGSAADDHLFAKAAEQAKLKWMKGSLLMGFAAYEAARGCAEMPDDASEGMRRLPSLLKQQGNTGTWLGATFKKWSGQEIPDIQTLKNPVWRPGNAEDLKVRCQGYKRNRKKQDALESLPYGSMYECVSCDALTSDKRIDNIVGRLVQLEQIPGLDNASTNGVSWAPGCPLPRIICINLMLPYTTGPKDPGCSFVAFFHIKPEVLKELQKEVERPCLRMFIDFCKGPAGTSSDPSNPKRSLGRRRDTTRKADDDDGLLKATAWCENTEQLSVPGFMKRFNGKPALITNSGYIIRQNNDGGGSPPGEWIELGLDVREFNWMARQSLVSYRSLLPRAAIHFGFMVQAVEDEDMPEGLICDMHVYGVDMEMDPLNISA